MQKSEVDTQTSSKIDMSLDDIIKLNRKQARKAPNRPVRVQTARGISGRSRNFGRGASKPVVGIQLRSLRQRRLARTLMRGRGVRTQLRAIITKKPSIRPGRSAALEVLKRARQTAAAAARTAADAVTLIQRNRVQRRRLFDERRGLQATRGIVPRRPVRRTNKDSFGRFQPNAGPDLSVRRSRIPERRRRPVGTVTYARPVNVPLQPIRATNRSRGLTRRGNGGSSRGRTPTGGIYNAGPSRRPVGDFTRNAEYLAQARALIRAQTEQATRLMYQSQSNSTRRWSMTNQPPRGLNYYAQYWDNAH